MGPTTGRLYSECSEIPDLDRELDNAQQQKENRNRHFLIKFFQSIGTSDQNKFYLLGIHPLSYLVALWVLRTRI